VVRLPFAFAAVLLVAGARPAQAPTPELPVELRTVEVVSRDGMVAAGTQEAARAGAAVLAAGGNAVDAAVAVGFALGASDLAFAGLGGQAYLLVRMADGRAVAIDGSALVPRAASRTELQRLRDTDAAWGHRMVAAPGALAALVHALERYGTRRLPELIAPAIEIAETGSRLTRPQRGFLANYLHKIRESDYLSSLILKDGVDPWEPEHVFCYPDLAVTLRRIAALGPREFYVGGIAARIEADMQANGGYLRRSDLAQVRPVERQPLRARYRDCEVLGFPSPGGGGSLLAALQMLDRFPPALVTGDSLDRLQLLVEAVRIAMIDAADSRAPAELAQVQLLDPARAARRAALIRFDRALTDAEITDVAPRTWFEKDTTHFSVADRFGNVVAATLSLGRGWGAGTATPGLGFPHNALLEGFDYLDPASRAYLEPARRPLTTMSPTIVLRNGRPLLLLGSAGTERIISSTLQPLVNVVDGGMSLGDAVSRPRVLWGGNQDRKVYLELAGEITVERADALAARGYPTMYRHVFPGDAANLGAFGCVNAVLIDHARGVFIGVGDPRREGTAVGVAPDPQR
jgi:gamma-glutamyltranspeptidase/glutathione hydrolase